MRFYSNSMLRTLFSLLIGVALIVWAEEAGKYLVILLGAGFFFPALLSLLLFLTHRKQEGAPAMAFPFFGLGSLVFGFWLMINPGFFVAFLMYLLGALLLFMGISLLVNLVGFRRLMSVGVGFYVLPSLLILVGLLVLWNPFSAASIPFILLGVSCIFYAVSNAINDLKFRRQEAKIIEEIQEAEAAEEAASAEAAASASSSSEEGNGSSSEIIETVDAEEVK